MRDNKVNFGSETLPKNKRKMKIFLCLLLLCAAAGILVLFLFDRRTHHFRFDEVRKADIAALSEENYDGLLLSMYTPKVFDAEDFNYYRAIPTAQAFHTFENLSDIGDYLEHGFSHNANLSAVYIGLDPYAISGLYGHHASLYIRDYASYLTDYVQSYPDTHFELLLPSYPLDHLQALSDKEYEELITAYRNLVNLYTPHDNVVIYFVGYEEWLIANPGNYDNNSACKPDIAHTILTFTFQDDHYALTPDNMEERFTQMTALVQTPPTVYPDYSDYSIVFFGDSPIGNYHNSLSIPGVVAGLSGAHTYNLGLGGTSACGNRNPKVHTLNTIVDAFLAGDNSSFEESASPYFGISAYQTEHTENLCFIINYGLNDYFFGMPISSSDPLDPYTYMGSIRLAVGKLREVYPDCKIILATPNFTSYFGAGKDINSDVGGQMTDYVDAVLALSEELDLDCMNNYVDFGITNENHGLYLEDGCHPNVSLRYTYGQHIIEKLSDMLSK
ncbi:MAG: SGNH/GDSL hydrolase family protein [Acetatifactor sp.]|nr:SGNH/GDSL hydrolase family protein [Acetatifactor sp.]